MSSRDTHAPLSAVVGDPPAEAADAEVEAAAPPPSAPPCDAAPPSAAFALPLPLHLAFAAPPAEATAAPFAAFFGPALPFPFPLPAAAAPEPSPPAPPPPPGLPLCPSSPVRRECIAISLPMSAAMSAGVRSGAPRCKSSTSASTSTSRVCRNISAFSELTAPSAESWPNSVLLSKAKSSRWHADTRSLTRATSPCNSSTLPPPLPPPPLGLGVPRPRPRVSDCGWESVPARAVQGGVAGRESDGASDWCRRPGK